MLIHSAKRPDRRAAPRLPALGRWTGALTDHVARRARYEPQGRGLGLSVLITPAALLVCVALLMRQVTPETLAELGHAVAGFSIWQWLCAVALTWGSYLAIGRNEAVAHDLLETGVDHRRARRAGMQAVALAQALGFGTITAAFARKRALPDLAMWPLARLSVVASLAFLAALGGLALLAVLYTRTGTLWLSLSAGLVAVVILRRTAPVPSLPGLRPGRVFRLILWTALDTALAAAVLYTFMPAGTGLGLTTIFCAYLIALGAGLISQSPGGLGALELSMVLLLPSLPTGQLLAALFAYRVVYHGLPALVAIVALMRPQWPATATALLPVAAKSAQRAAHRVGQGDWGLIHQGAEALLSRDQSEGWLSRRTATALVTIGRPLGNPRIRDVADTAARTGHLPLLYKCDPRTAVQARKAGWYVLPIAHEAVIHPAAWSADGSERRQLRRKLRSATKAGLRIEHRTGRLPYDDMRRVSEDWRARNGTERGFSMGRFAPDLLVRQRIVLAWQGDTLAGFASFHKTGEEWGLDLMRLSTDAPSGTMQSLIAAAISLAREKGVERVSLAACPHQHAWLPQSLLNTDSWQFKRSFGPKWQPRYAAAPSKTALIIGLANTALAIHRPAPLPAPPRERRRWPRGPMFRFDLSGTTCDATSEKTQAATATSGTTAAPLRSAPYVERPDDPS